MDNKKICIIGTEYVDICLFLSRMFNALGKQTALVDNTKEKYLASCVPGVGLVRDMVDYRNVSVMLNKRYQVIEEQYDVSIFVQGNNADEELIKNADEVFLIIDQNMYTFDRLKNVVPLIKRPVHVIYHNFVKSKNNEESIAIRLGLTKQLIASSHYINYNEKDRECCVLAQYNNIYHFEKLSCMFKTELRNMANILYENIPDVKHIGKEFRMAELVG